MDYYDLLINAIKMLNPTTSDSLIFVCRNEQYSLGPIGSKNEVSFTGKIDQRKLGSAVKDLEAAKLITLERHYFPYQFRITHTLRVQLNSLMESHPKRPLGFQPHQG